MNEYTAVALFSSNFLCFRNTVGGYKYLSVLMRRADTHAELLQIIQNVLSTAALRDDAHDALRIEDAAARNYGHAVLF